MRRILDQGAEFPNTHEQRVDAYSGRRVEPGSVGCGLGRDLDVEESMSAARARRRRLSIG